MRLRPDGYLHAVYAVLLDTEQQRTLFGEHWKTPSKQRKAKLKDSEVCVQETGDFVTTASSGLRTANKVQRKRQKKQPNRNLKVSGTASERASDCTLTYNLLVTRASESEPKAVWTASSTSRSESLSRRQRTIAFCQLPLGPTSWTQKKI